MNALTPEIKAGIFAGESGGDYNALFSFANRPGGQFANIRLTDMTLDEALAFADPGGEYGQFVKGKVGRVATPMGAYQVVGTTLKAAKEGLGLTGNERMTPETQDAIGEWILAAQGTGAWEGYKGPGDPSSIPPSNPQDYAETGNALRGPEGDPAAYVNALWASLEQQQAPMMQQPQTGQVQLNPFGAYRAGQQMRMG